MQEILPLLIVSASPLPRHLKKGAYVRVTKLRATEGGMPACPRPLYSPGAWHNVLSLPIGYWMEGTLLADVVKLGAILLRRRFRDGVDAQGIFRSTQICTVVDKEIMTYNSVYLIEEVTPSVAGLRS